MRRVVALSVLMGALALGQMSDAERQEAHAVELHNKFATAYNSYVEQRKNGVLDLQALREARRAWARMEAESGWPKN